VRKYLQYRDDARELTTGLCILLAIGVVGTVVVSALALAGVTVFSSYAYLSVTTSVKMPSDYWYHVFLERLRDAGVLTTLLVVGTAFYKSCKLAEGGQIHGRNPRK
jgi:hypothetical protein